MQSLSPTTGQATARSGARLRVRVAPGAARSEVVGRLGDAWKLRVRSAPERGRANDEVVRLLAGVLRVPVRDVTVVSGHASRAKVVEVDGVSPDEVERRLSSRSAAA